MIAPRSRRHRLALTLVATTCATPAAAQLLQDVPTVIIPAEPPLTAARSIFLHDRGTPVAERMLPAFAAQGTTVGAFDIYPAVAVGGLFTSNIFADDRRRESDEAIVVRPEVTVRTSAGPYQLAAYGRGDLRRYARHGSEDTEEALGGVEGSLAIGSLSSITGGVSYGSLIDPRFAADSPADATKPLEYNALTAFAGTTIEGARTRLILRGDFEQLRFGTTPSVNGGTLLTRDRDRSRVAGLARLERAISPAFSLYGAASANKIDYRYASFGIPSRDSSGYGLYLGSSFEVTALVRGDVRLGYVRQNFDISRFRPISGLGAFGTVVIFPNRLWTFTAHGESVVEDSGVPGTGGLLHQGGFARADHELRRWLIASFEGGFFKDSYRGLIRRDRLPYADAGVTYLSRNHWNARLGYRYLARSCACSGDVSEFSDHRLSATLTFQD